MFKKYIFGVFLIMLIPCLVQGDTVTIYPTPEQDGFTGRDPDGDGQKVNDEQDLFRVGDYKEPVGDNDIVCGFIGFNLSSIPDGATITSAKVYLKAKGSWVNDSPDLSKNTPFYVDHCDFGDYIDPEDVDLQCTSSDSNIHTMTEADLEVRKNTWLSFDVTKYVKIDYKKKKSPSRYRIRPAKVTQDDEKDNAKFLSVDAKKTEEHPYLEVVYSTKKGKK